MGFFCCSMKCSTCSHASEQILQPGGPTLCKGLNPENPFSSLAISKTWHACPLLSATWNHALVSYPGGTYLLFNLGCTV